MAALVSVKLVSDKHGPEKVGAQFTCLHATTITVLQSFDDTGGPERPDRYIKYCFYYIISHFAAPGRLAAGLPPLPGSGPFPQHRFPPKSRFFKRF